MTRPNTNGASRKPAVWTRVPTTTGGTSTRAPSNTIPATRMPTTCSRSSANSNRRSVSLALPFRIQQQKRESRHHDDRGHVSDEHREENGIIEHERYQEELDHAEGDRLDICPEKGPRGVGVETIPIGPPERGDGRPPPGPDAIAD